MKRNIVINSSRTALIITDHLHSGVELITADTAIGEEIFAFDTHLHVCYCFKNTVSGYEIIEEFIPLMKFRSFAKHNEGDYGKTYKSLIRSVINE